ADRDGPAKDIAEEQHKHNGLNRGENPLFWDARNLREMALCHHQRVRKYPVNRRALQRRQFLRRADIAANQRELLTRGRWASVSDGCSVSSAGRPVRVRKTSSNVGRRRARSSTRTRAPSRSRTIAASCCAPLVSGTSRCRRSVCTWISPE